MTISARHEAAGQVVIIFADNGVGMSAENLKRIFDPFFTTKMGEGGSGLGMNLVYNIVTSVLGGTITITSEPGQGAEVKIMLPVKAPQECDSQEAVV